jgi:hypothetical protein
VIKMALPAGANDNDFISSAADHGTSRAKTYLTCPDILAKQMKMLWPPRLESLISCNS